MFISRFLPQVLMVLSIFTIPAWAPAQTSSDLLEKAVYAEETTGDLGEAIGLYEQVIAQTKAATHIGAEAQYRLGLCLEKQGDKKKATEAFQAVMDDFPNETEFVTLAKKYLPGAPKLIPVPWTGAQQFHMEMSLPTGMKIGKFIYSIDAVEHNGQPVWRCSNRGVVTIQDGNSYSEVFCDKQNFAPIESHWKHWMLGLADATYSGDKATVKILGRDSPLKMDFTPPGYDNEQGVQLFRRLPLEIGLHTEIPIIATLTGNVIPLEIDVPEKEMITTSAGEFNCYRLELKLLKQTFWISDDENRYPVRFSAGGINGDLIRVGQRSQGDSLEIADDQFSITLPAEWDSYEPQPEKEGRVIHLLDPRAIATFVKLTIAPKEGLADGQRAKGLLNEGEQSTPQTWLDMALSKRAKRLKGYKVMGTDIGSLELSDSKAAAEIFEFEKEGKSMTGYFVSLAGEEMAGFFKFVVPTDQFESQRGDYDALVRSLRLK